MWQFICRAPCSPGRLVPRLCGPWPLQAGTVQPRLRDVARWLLGHLHSHGSQPLSSLVLVLCYRYPAQPLFPSSPSLLPPPPRPPPHSSLRLLLLSSSLSFSVVCFSSLPLSHSFFPPCSVRFCFALPLPRAFRLSSCARLVRLSATRLSDYLITRHLGRGPIPTPPSRPAANWGVWFSTGLLLTAPWMHSHQPKSIYGYIRIHAATCYPPVRACILSCVTSVIPLRKTQV